MLKKLSSNIIIYGGTNGIKSLVPFLMLPILTIHLSVEDFELSFLANKRTYEKNFLEQKLIDFFESRVNIKGNIKNKIRAIKNIYDLNPINAPKNTPTIIVKLFDKMPIINPIIKIKYFSFCVEAVKNLK